MMHSILIIGQSNMAGRGFFSETEPIVNDKLHVLRNGRWQKMFTPVNPDRHHSGVNLAETFADLYAKEHDASVGIIPCADGGTCLEQWAVGGLLFDHACYMASLAQRTSTIVAVLWHQGESDCEAHLYPLYEERVTVILNAFRERLGLHDVPFLLGGLGDFLKDCDRSPELKNYTHVNDAIRRVASKMSLAGFVSAEGLSSNPDKLHFSAQALREFGVRYYKEFLKLENKERIFEEKSTKDSVIRTIFDKL